MLKKGMMKNRCRSRVYAGFMPGKKVGKKTSIPYRLVTNDQDLFSFAGIWDEFEDTDGNEFHTFSIDHELSLLYCSHDTRTNASHFYERK